MPKHLLLTLAVVVGLVITVGVWTHAAQTPVRQCTVVGEGAFDPGWVEKTPTGVYYRCVPTFNSSLAPSGAAWVRVNSDGTIGAVLPR